MSIECLICMKEIKTIKSKTIISNSYITDCKCNYYYHYGCISKWLKIKRNCPICKNIILHSLSEYYLNKFKRKYKYDY